MKKIILVFMLMLFGGICMAQSASISDLYNGQFGQKGSHYVNDNLKHTYDATVIVMSKLSVVDSIYYQLKFSITGNAIKNDTFPAGFMFVGRFSGLKLKSGAAMMFKDPLK
jgi:hypothetical protein